MVLVASMGVDGAIVMASIVGALHVLGPDHLVTLLALSVLLKPLQAFQVGIIWSLGHLTGMAAVSVIAVPLAQAEGGKFWWDRIGNYVIGATMVLAALYFIVREGSQLQEMEDGTIVPKGCCCQDHHIPSKPADEEHGSCGHEAEGHHHGHGHAHSHCADSHDNQAGHGHAHSHSADHHAGHSHCSGSCEGHEPAAPSESTPLLPKEAAPASRSFFDTPRKIEGIILGLVSGMCCPATLLGLSTMATLHGLGAILAFYAVLLSISVFGAGAFCAGIAFASTYGASSQKNMRTIYRCSCYCMLLLGIAWIVATKRDVLDRLDYTSSYDALPTLGLNQTSP